jgi:hypothetical protein
MFFCVCDYQPVRRRIHSLLRSFLYFAPVESDSGRNPRSYPRGYARRRSRNPSPSGDRISLHAYDPPKPETATCNGGGSCRILRASRLPKLADFESEGWDLR